MDSQTTNKTKVFLDSSVLLAACLSSIGSAADLLTYADRGDIEVCLSRTVLEEVERNLTLKAPQGLPRFMALRGQLSGHLASPSRELIEQAAGTVELKDAPIVAGAVQAGADFIDSYDRRHLVNRSADIESAFGISVLTPADLLATVELPLIDHGPATNP